MSASRSSTTPQAGQFDLFGAPPLPALPGGMQYRADFISPEEEAALLDGIVALPLREALYKSYTARRRVVSYGSQYDFERNALQPSEPLPAWLLPLQQRAAAWIGVDPQAFAHALVAEYRPGTPLGWHRDVPDFETIVGVSLAGSARMRFRRYPPAQATKSDAFVLELAARSAYVLQGESRWGWQHSVAPTTGLRYSITFRTPSARRRRA
jgi:alkylated DNA repair dioxygenase AlkB